MNYTSLSISFLILFFLGAGMPLQVKQAHHTSTELLIPIHFIVQFDGQRGGIIVKYKIGPSQKSLCKMVGFEWSLDQETWFNGGYLTRRKFSVSNKPSNQKIFVKIRGKSKPSSIVFAAYYYNISLLVSPLQIRNKNFLFLLLRRN